LSKYVVNCTYDYIGWLEYANVTHLKGGMHMELQQRLVHFLRQGFLHKAAQGSLL